MAEECWPAYKTDAICTEVSVSTFTSSFNWPDPFVRLDLVRQGYNAQHLWYSSYNKPDKNSSPSDASYWMEFLLNGGISALIEDDLQMALISLLGELMMGLSADYNVLEITKNPPIRRFERRGCAFSTVDLFNLKVASSTMEKYYTLILHY